MDIEITLEDGIHRLKVSGKLDALTGTDYEQRVNRLITDGVQRFVMDFSPLVYISSAGLRALLNTSKSLMAQGGVIVYANLQSNVYDVFEMTGLLSLFKVYESLPEAFAAVQQAVK